VIALSLALIVWSFAAFVFAAAAFSAVGRMLDRVCPQADGARASWPRIAILRPCEGPDHELAENLLSAATARYDGEREVLVLVPSASDPAYAEAERAIAEAKRRAPSVPMHLVVTAIETSANRKVAQLARARTGAEVLVLADSDLRFDDRTLPSLVAVLEADPAAGAASAPYLERNGTTLGDAVSAMLLSSTPHAFLCLAALAERSGGAHVMGGALVAIRRRILEELGGFTSLEPFLGEDFELARRLHARGWTIATSPAPATVMDRGRTVSSVVQKFSRWCTVTRQQRAHLFPTYLLLLGASPLLLALALAVAIGRPPLWTFALAATALALVVRAALASRLRAAYRLPSGPLRSLVAALAGETLIVFSALGALGRPIIEWRGVRYRVGAGGLLQRLH
jgi:cellulose synthase/poly-beta-1,6-N-acetylglucosamine synthase-like glycosyltransferase